MEEQSSNTPENDPSKVVFSREVQEEVLSRFGHSLGMNSMISILKEANLHNAVDVNGEMFLHAVARFDDDTSIAIAKNLIKFDRQINAQNNQGKTPLMVSIRNRCKNITDLLLDANADIFIIDIEGKSALHYLADTQWYDHYYLVRKFFKKVERHCHNDSQAIAIKLFNAGWSLHGITLEDIEIAKWMLVLGCQVDAKEPINDRTILHEAVLADYVEWVQLLLNHDANPNALDKFNRSPLDYVYENENVSVTEHYHTSERLKIIKMLIDQGAKMFVPNANSDIGLNQIKGLLKYGNGQVIQILLQANLDLNKIDASGNTPLHILAENKKLDVYEVLENQIFNVNIRNSDLDTPLSIAASFRNACAVKFFLKRGAYVNVWNNNYLSPLYACIKASSSNLQIEDQIKYEECIRLLLEYHADLELEGDNNSNPIFDIVENQEIMTVRKLLIAHLVLQEASGTRVNERIHHQVNSKSDLKVYYQTFKVLGKIAVYKSVTLLDVLSENRTKFERRLRHKEWESRIEKYLNESDPNSWYLGLLLKNRFLRAVHIIKLKKEAAVLFCQIVSISPMIADEIIDYLHEPELKNLLKVSL